MLEIVCPWCGRRAHTEFTYEGDAAVARPANTEDLEAFYQYVFERENTRGWHDEVWQHTSGCRRFLAVRRHLTTHEILGTAKPGTPLPQIDETS